MCRFRYMDVKKWLNKVKDVEVLSLNGITIMLFVMLRLLQ